jgi:hypothetical protein
MILQGSRVITARGETDTAGRLVGEHGGPGIVDVTLELPTTMETAPKPSRSS